ncbi:MAG: hypothetical protein MUF13_14605, partial [Akkermansiaceae bacterium]|nr:hypothetical protein [Akkermansiaceae bacterium]
MKSIFLLSAASVVFLAGCAGISNPLANTPGPSSKHPDILRQQIFLDSENFGPGVVDGHLGEFTRKAMVNYRQAKSLPAEWMPDISNIPAHTVYRITSQDLSLIGTNAEEPEDQAKQSKMPYTTA